MELRTLTRAEEEVMRILWQLERAFVKDILAEFPEPKPAYNTVSTIVRILEKKGFVGYTAFGKTHEYYPLVARDAYKRHEVEQLMGNYFENSLSELVSFFMKNQALPVSELDEVIRLLREKQGPTN